MHDLEVLVNSRNRLIILESEHEERYIDAFRRIAARSNRAYFRWTITQGLVRLAPNYSPQSVNKDISQLFGQILSTDLSSVYVLVDFHHYLSEPVTIRYIKDVLLHTPEHTLVLLSQAIEVPEDLRRMARYFKRPLPSRKSLNEMISDLALDWHTEQGVKLKVLEKGLVDRLVKSLDGLTLDDAERFARRAIWDDGIINRDDLNNIAKEKFDLLNTDNVLSLELDYEDLDSIAGFTNLKSWLNLRRKIFLGQVDLPGGDRPRGMLLLGVQGCGKSMAAKAVAGAWELPLLHLDFATLYNRFYGQTEANLRHALSTAEKMQPCVLWIDEIEKGMSAVSNSDDVSKRVLGTFLTWLAERKESVFVVATANDVSTLPPELMRKGRFDEVFFVDLPDKKERSAILRLHLERRKQAVNDINCDRLASVTEGFSGAELEQLVVSALYHSYADQSAVSQAMLFDLAGGTQPLSVLMAERIDSLRTWAAGRAVAVS